MDFRTSRKYLRKNINIDPLKDTSGSQDITEDEIKKILSECLSTKAKDGMKQFFDPSATNMSTPCESKTMHNIIAKAEAKRKEKPDAVNYAIKNYLKNIIVGISNENYMEKLIKNNTEMYFENE